ncbi:MAG: hypothetical protein AB8I08_37920 [Sandaracinaceae bacterium]
MPGDRVATTGGHLVLTAVATTGPQEAPNLVTRLDAWGTRILIAGEADATELRALSRSPHSELRSEVLVVLRPGIVVPDLLIEAVQPRLLVVHRNRGGASVLDGGPVETLEVGLGSRSAIELSEIGFRVRVEAGGDAWHGRGVAAQPG